MKNVHRDVGTTLLLLPKSDADEIHRHIPGSKPDGIGGYDLPCTTNTSVAFRLGGKVFPIDTKNLVITNGDSCSSGIIGVESGSDGLQTKEWLVSVISFSCL